MYKEIYKGFIIEEQKFTLHYNGEEKELPVFYGAKNEDCSIIATANTIKELKHKIDRFIE